MTVCLSSFMHHAFIVHLPWHQVLAAALGDTITALETMAYPMCFNLQAYSRPFLLLSHALDHTDCSFYPEFSSLFSLLI